MHLVEQRGCAVLRMNPRGTTITADIYYQQLSHLADTIQQEGPTSLPEVMLLHDNARPHSANLTKNTIQEFGLEVIPHPPYSPDLEPSDFHLLRSLSNDLQGTSFPDVNVLRLLQLKTKITTGAESKNYPSVGRLL